MTKCYLGKCDAPDLSLLPSADSRRKFRTALYHELCSGIRYDELPPIVIKVGTAYTLIDGFTRVKALKKRGQERWCFDVYEINDGFTLSELRDEIGLGANNHVVAKRATKADFIISGLSLIHI